MVQWLSLCGGQFIIDHTGTVFTLKGGNSIRFKAVPILRAGTDRRHTRPVLGPRTADKPSTSPSTWPRLRMMTIHQRFCCRRPRICFLPQTGRTAQVRYPDADDEL